MALLVSLVILVVGGPVLAFPDVLPEAVRSLVTTSLAITALAAATTTLWPVSALRIPLVLFVGTVAFNAVVHSDAPAVSLRHAAGVSLGVLSMAVVAMGGQSAARFRLACLAIGLGGVLIVGAGVGSTYFGWDGQKLVLGSTSEQQKLLYPWLPQAQLPVPGLESEEGWVNANALGGTALMVLPLLASLIVAARRESMWTRAAFVVLGCVGTTLSLSAIWMSRSRTAILATAILLVLASAQWRAARRVVIATLVIAAIAFGISFNARRHATPGLFERGVASTVTNLRARAAYWQLAAVTLTQHPVVGIGISRFHEGPPDATGQRQYIAHAHNIFLQVALDVGLLGLLAYLWIFGWVTTSARRGLSGSERALAAGAALSIVGAHLFGLTDAIALGAKVGLFQWLCAGLLIAAWHFARSGPRLPS